MLGLYMYIAVLNTTITNFRTFSNLFYEFHKTYTLCVLSTVSFDCISQWCMGVTISAVNTHMP